MYLKGIIPPLTTPFDSKGNLVPEKLQANIKFLSKYDLSGYLLLGSNGEFVMLSDEEKLEILKAGREVIPKEKIMLAGTGCQSTRETIWLTGKAAEAGADAALVLNPFYYKGSMTRQALSNHFRAVADNSPIPVLIYNMPASTGIDLEAQLIIELADHPNIVGLKDSGSNLVKLGNILN
ncbi:MAG: dihydrodipicolinate synthase family protein, partial [Bacteroidota bacterium]|nr:dihydrodipicolinate synthase family protein [Bacteroidota bacterium]